MKSFSETKGTVTRTTFVAQLNCFANEPVQHPFLASLERDQANAATATVITLHNADMKLAA